MNANNFKCLICKEIKEWDELQGNTLCYTRDDIDDCDNLLCKDCAVCGKCGITENNCAMCGLEEKDGVLLCMDCGGYDNEDSDDDDSDDEDSDFEDYIAKRMENIENKMVEIAVKKEIVEKLIQKIGEVRSEAEIHKIEKKIEMVLEDKKEDINIKMTTANSNMNDKYYLNEGCMERHFFDEYISENASDEIIAKIEEYWTDPEEFLEYRVFGLENPTDRKGLEYSECWLLDYKDGYLPVIHTGINSSSRYSMCRCGMDRELDDDEEQERLTLDEICEMMSGEYKTTLKTKIHKIEKKVRATAEDKNAIKLNDTQKIDSNPKTITEDKIIQDTKMNANTNTNTSPKIVVSAPKEIRHIAEGLEKVLKEGIPSVPAEEYKTLADKTITMTRQSNHHRNTGNMKVSNDLPLFMREGGMEEIARRRKELETYLKLLNANPEQMIRGHTLVILNPATLDPNQVGEQQAKDIRKWFDTPQTKQEINRWLGCGTHKVDGKSWCAGEMGSRWADKKINGRQVRFAFYADKDQKPEHLKHLAYSIAIDASM